MFGPMTSYDVIIAGCGPAGATAGHILARHGIATAIIDRSVFPRPKLCGGLLPLKTIALLEKIYGVTRDNLVSEGIVNHTSCEYEIFFRKELLVHRTTDLPFAFVDRTSYDHYLMEKARQQGATIIEAERVTGVDPEAGTLETDRGTTYRARYIIGADGVHGAVRKCFPSTRDARRKKTQVHAAAMEVFLPASSLCRKVDHPMIHLGYVDWGYAWVFPNRDRVIVGLGGLPERNRSNLRDILHTYLSDLALVNSEETVRGLRVHGHPIPYGITAESPAYRNTILAGDAAGLTDPITGEGIYYAHRSGQIAAKSIIHVMENGGSLEAIFLKLLGRHVYPELRSAWALQAIVFTALELLPQALIGAMVRLGNGRALKVIHGIRPYPLNFRYHDVYGDIHA